MIGFPLSSCESCPPAPCLRRDKLYGNDGLSSFAGVNLRRGDSELCENDNRGYR